MKRASVLVLALAALPAVLAAGIPPTFPATFGPSATSPSSTSDSSTTSSTASSSTSAASPTGTPTLLFVPLDTQSQDVDTCSSDFSIQWVWESGGNFTPLFTLSVTNINVTQKDPPSTLSESSPDQIVNPLSDVRRAIIPSVASGSVISTGTVSAPPGSATTIPGLIESLTTSLDPSAQDIFTWNVNLPQGWYNILATATDAGDDVKGAGGIWASFNAASESFFIRNGSDTSCLAAIGSATTASSTSPGSTTIPGATDTASASGVGSLSSPSHVNRGAIAGGVVGGLAVIVAILGACLWFRQGRRRSTISADDAGAPRSNFGKWGALGSFDSANGTRSAPKSNTAADQLDPVTVLNTSANSRTSKSGGFGLGDMGLAALGLAKSQDKGPSAHTPQSKRNRRPRQSKNSSFGTIDSTGAILASSSSSPTSSAHGHYDPYANYGVFNNAELAYSPHEKGVPMHNLSPTFTPAEEEYHQSKPYVPSSDSLDSDAPGVGVIPIAYEGSPFVTPPPSEPASRHNSTSYSRTSLGGAAQVLSDSSSAPGRTQSKSNSSSPTSSRPMGVPDVPETPRNDSLISNQNRASSPDAIVYTLVDREQLQLGSNGSKGPSKRAVRKPVPSYTPDDSGMFSDTSPVSPVYTYAGTAPSTSTKPSKAGGQSRRAAPEPPSESGSSSSSSFFPAQGASSPQNRMYASTVHSLEHKDSAHSLASLRNMEGDLSGYGSVLGKDGKQMHVLIPDMPLPQN
jgi:hypothetical protein